jgi:hypothetical protein
MFSFPRINPRKRKQCSILIFLNPCKRIKSAPLTESVIRITETKIQNILESIIDQVCSQQQIYRTQTCSLVLKSVIDQVCSQPPKIYTKLACEKLKQEIKSAGKKAIENTTRKKKNGEITNTEIAFYSSIERSFVTYLGHGIERVAAVADHVECVGSVSHSLREKATDIRIHLDTKVMRVEIKTSSNTKCGTDFNHMIESCTDNIEGWWVVAFQKFSEKKKLKRKIFNRADEKRRLGTVEFWKMCGIDYHELVKIWFRKDFILDEMIQSHFKSKQHILQSKTLPKK